MDPSIVGSPQFGIIWRKKLLGTYNGWNGSDPELVPAGRELVLIVLKIEQIFAQALVYTPDNTQFVYVVSQQNWVYKIDAKTGDILLARNLQIPFLVSELDNCNDISQTIGSTVRIIFGQGGVAWLFLKVLTSFCG